MKVYVYAIESLQDGRIYVGQTSDVERRVKEHNKGAVRSTKYYKPWKPIYFKDCNNRVEARQLEKYLKSGCGKEFLKSIACP